MGISYVRLKNLKARQIIKALEKDGAVKLRQKGSHIRFGYADGRRVTVAISNKPIPLGTIQDIFTQSRWTENDLTRLGFL
jgi:predicted RNA binding protein YcfA (HicA-like mRNA interferase family)